MEAVENAVGVTKEKAEEDGVKNIREESGNGELGELFLGIRRNV